MKKLIVTIFIVGALLPIYAGAQEGASRPFAPTWKLLKFEEKQQFIAGYLKSQTDLKEVLELAIEHSAKDPQLAVGALKSLKSLYDTPPVDVGALVTQLDTFYSEPNNRNASLSRAISSVGAQ